jgi:predicted transposase/invertase (TIGR01784 family)
MSDLISFDYAIKYLLKDKADYDIVEGFISALIAQEGYKPVKIKALLEPESNKESKLLKRSIADLIVEDEDGNNYIIEIDRAYTNLFLHKAVFNTSRLIVDNLGTNQDYLKIKKVFHINLLYFPFPDTKSPLHHGKVIFHEIDKAHPVDFHLVDRGMNIFDLHNIFPEYFVISIPLFDDVIRQEIDEWLYLMKHSEVKESFKSPYMQKVAERLNILKMTNAERNIYDSYIMDSMKGRDYLVSAEERGARKGLAEGIQIGKEEGMQLGKEEGMQLAKIEMAKKMLGLNIALDIVAATTGLSMEALERLKKE